MDCNHQWWVFGQADSLLLLVCTKCTQIGTRDATNLFKLSRTGHLFRKLERWNGDPRGVQIRRVLPMEGVGEDGLL